MSDQTSQDGGDEKVRPSKAILSSLWGLVLTTATFGQQVELQPLREQARRVVQSLSFLGQPLPQDVQRQFDRAMSETDRAAAIEAIQKVLDPLCLARIDINAESRVKVAAGQAPRQLVEQGWTVFLVKVSNLAGVTARLRASSPNALPLQVRSSGSPTAQKQISQSEVSERWLDVRMFDDRPMTPTLSGLPIEYRVIQLLSRDRGQREASLSFDVGQGTQDIGFRNAVPILFDCRPARRIQLNIVDVDGQPATAEFVIRDAHGRIYPSRSRRLEPDFFFHDQIYRSDGEEVLLPSGEYEVTFSRGPEYLVEKRTVDVGPAAEQTLRFQLRRWIHMAKQGWYSGDHHIHAAGCSHYEAPTEGVLPKAMMRHILGEDLNVGCVLSWGPCWYHQKQFFDGKVHPLSSRNHLMRYDVEVSGFPSSHCGHLCLLRLKEDDYPGTTKIEQWPSWDLPVLRWGKEQGGIVGFSHSGWGLEVEGDVLPNYKMPRFDGIGANEYIVDVVHNVCDFISAVDTPIIWELSPWYHTLNCGFTCRISGETDFPCIYGERVGLGRSYVKLEDQQLDYDAWVEGIRDGRSYVSDGLSHLFDFEIDGVGVGEPGPGGRVSTLAVSDGDELAITVQASAFLEKEPREDLRKRPLSQKPYWHVERARIGDSRNVAVELIVNGQSVEQQEVVADGTIHQLSFRYRPKYSSWVAVRVFPSSHTNPIFVEVDGKPIRASKRSAKWCLKAVDVCWNSKVRGIRETERDEAAAAYDKARDVYRQILSETIVE